MITTEHDYYRAVTSSFALTPVRCSWLLQSSDVISRSYSYEMFKWLLQSSDVISRSYI